MASVRFLIQSKNDNAPIYVRLRDGRKLDLKVKTSFIINPLEWNAEKERPKHTKTENLKKLDVDLIDLKSNILKAYNQRIENNSNIDNAWLQEIISPDQNSKIPTKLVPYFDYYLLLKGNTIKHNTIKKITSYKTLLISFEKKQKKSYQINEVDINFQKRLEAYCTSNNYSTNYISDILKYIRTICKNAGQNGVKSNIQTESLRIKKTEVSFTYLTLDEIEIIKNKKYDFDYLDNVRDWLLISCETGQRISDFMKFKKSMIREATTPKGKKIKLIEFTQEKTGKKMSVVVTEMVEEILKKRNGNFPRAISDQKYNDYIKIVCELAGIDEIVQGSMKDKETKRQISGYFKKYQLVSSHIGRRSFASNYYMKYPIGYLMRQTGHSSERTFLNYIGKSNSDFSLAFADELFDKK
jgi:hypothetical protein